MRRGNFIAYCGAYKDIININNEIELLISSFYPLAAYNRAVTDARSNEKIPIYIFIDAFLTLLTLTAA